MVLMRQRINDPALSHQLKRGAVRQAPFLVVHAAVKIERATKLQGGLRYDVDIEVGANCFYALNGKRAWVSSTA